MKKFLLFIAVLLISEAVLAAHTIRLQKNNYTLQLIRDTPYVEQGISNHYIRNNETSDNWTKMIVVQSYPHVKDPIVAAQHLYDKYQENENVSVSPIISNGRSTAVLAFVMLNSQEDSIVYEGNVLRFEKAKEGVIVMQYIERTVQTPPPTQKLAEQVQKNLKPIIRIFTKMKAPNIVKEIRK